MYLPLAPFTVGLAAPLLHQVRGLLGDAGERGWVLAVQVWTALLAVVPALVLYGHGEDALALLAVVAAVRLAGRGRFLAAGVALGVAVASKQWALLAEPALVAWSPRRGRLRLAGVGLAVLARCAFEPVVHVYCLAPGLCLLLAHERVATGRCGRTALAGGLLVGWFAVHPAPALWSTVAALLGAAVAYRAAGETFAASAAGTAAAPLGGAQSR